MKFKITAMLFRNRIDKINHYLNNGFKQRAKIASECLKGIHRITHTDMQSVYQNNSDGIDQCEIEEQY